MAKLRVENFNDLVRDTETNAIINTNKSEYELYMFRHRERQEQSNQIRRTCREINSLKKELFEIKKMIKDMVK
tara:strand:+ start:2641 stop:2859 length:219 start_codon:yes stop_codon:yes gene_type:complete